jgi:hypothetical protein
MVALAVGLVLLLLVPGFALASPTIGRYRIIDTLDRPGMTCHLAQSRVGDGTVTDWWTLDRISVRPPRVFGVGDNDRVGWRFSVQRRILPLSGEPGGKWRTTHRSYTQFARASAETYAPFTRQEVAVAVPEERSWSYRVKVKMFWYNRDGLWGSAARHIDYFHQDVQNDDAMDGNFTLPCHTSQPQ